MRHGFREVEGFGVFVISACIGASPKWHSTGGITNTSESPSHNSETRFLPEH